MTHERAHILITTARALSKAAVDMGVLGGSLYAGETLRPGALSESAEALEAVAARLRAVDEQTSAE